MTSRFVQIPETTARPPVGKGPYYEDKQYLPERKAYPKPNFRQILQGGRNVLVDENLKVVIVAQKTHEGLIKFLPRISSYCLGEANAIDRPVPYAFVQNETIEIFVMHWSWIPYGIVDDKMWFQNSILKYSWKYFPLSDMSSGHILDNRGDLIHHLMINIETGDDEKISSVVTDVTNKKIIAVFTAPEQISVDDEGFYIHKSDSSIYYKLVNLDKKVETSDHFDIFKTINVAKPEISEISETSETSENIKNIETGNVAKPEISEVSENIKNIETGNVTKPEISETSESIKTIEVPKPETSLDAKWTEQFNNFKKEVLALMNVRKAEPKYIRLAIDFDRMCRECKACSREVILMPCKHSSFCEYCATRMTKCAVCQAPIEQFLSFAK